MMFQKFLKRKKKKKKEEKKHNARMQTLLHIVKI